MPAFHAIASAATPPAPAAASAAASGDADAFSQALTTASQDPTLGAFLPSRAQTGPNRNTGYSTPDSAHAAPTIPQAVSNAAQSAATSATQSASNAATAVTTATKAAAATPSTSTPATSTPTTVHSAAASVSAQAAAAKSTLKQQAATLKSQFQAQPASTTLAALAGMQTTLQNAPGAVSASTASSVTDLIKQASTGVTGGPGATQAHLANLTSQLNKIEARETGVDPSAPPAGWTEPPIFSQARALLNSLAGGTATTPAALKASGDPLATAGLPVAGVAPVTAANVQTTSTGTGLAQSAQTGQIAAALQATQATGAVGTAQLDPQMLKAASGQTTTQLSGAPQAPAKAPARAASSDAQATATTTVADASAQAAKAITPATPNPATPNKDANGGGDNNTALGAQVAEAAQAAKDIKSDDAAPAPVASDAADALAAQAQAQGQVAQTPAQTQLQAQLAAQTQAQTAADASHQNPQATSYLAAQMVKQLDGRSTQFDLQLHPADLGRVDVRMKIEQDGRLNAQLAFDNPAAAAEFRGRSDELKQQLQQAGFQLSDDSLTFSERNPQNFAQQQQGGGQQSGSDQSSLRSRAFQNSALNAQTADVVASSSSRVVTGLDLRV